MSFNVLAEKNCPLPVLAYKIPFKWGVHFDAGEVAITAAAIALNTLEQSMAAAVNTVPNGMIGFSMLYWQTAC